MNGPLTITHSDGGQARPIVGVAESGRVMEHAIGTVLFPAMAALSCLIRVVLQTGEVDLAPLHERLLDIRQKMFLVLLDGQDVVATLVDDLPGDGLLTA